MSAVFIEKGTYVKKERSHRDLFCGCANAGIDMTVFRISAFRKSVRLTEQLSVCFRRRVVLDRAGYR